MLSANESQRLRAVVEPGTGSADCELPTVRQCTRPAVMFTIVLMSVKKIPDATELCCALLFIQSYPSWPLAAPVLTDSGCGCPRLEQKSALLSVVAILTTSALTRAQLICSLPCKVDTEVFWGTHTEPALEAPT